MEALCFNLSGKTAFFKKPDVNIFYFTYSNIHRVALLGLIGAVMGYAGYNNQTDKDTYPEFYSKLKELKVSIVPKGDRGYFAKKIQYFNNSVGYASREEGGNLIVSEQWLENPEWDIYLLNDGSINKMEFNNIKDSILHGRCVYVPYLGKNDHAAVIKDARIVELNEAEEIDHIDSLFPNEAAEVESFSYNDEPMYFYREYLPWALDEALNSYMFKEMAFTNGYVSEIRESLCILNAEGKNLCFA